MLEIEPLNHDARMSTVSVRIRQLSQAQHRLSRSRDVEGQRGGGLCSEMIEKSGRGLESARWGEGLTSFSRNPSSVKRSC